MFCSTLWRDVQVRSQNRVQLHSRKPVLCPPIGTSLGFMHFLKILRLCVDFWLQITTKKNRSTLKQFFFKKKETQSTVCTQMTLSASQLTVPSGACYDCRWLILPHLAFAEMSSHLWQARCPHLRHFGRAAFR